MPRTADKFAFFVELALQQDENKYSDEQLAELMTEHFPAFAGPHMIPAYRRDYNRQLRPAFAKPDPALPKYIDGTPVPEGKRSLPKVKAAPEAEGDENFDAEVAKSAARAAKAKVSKAPKTTVKVAAKPATAPAPKLVPKKK